MSEYRNPGWSALLVAVGAVFAVVSILSAIFRGFEEPGTSFGDRWLPVLPILVLSAFCILRLARTGVVVEDEGIRVVNPLRTVRVPWERVMRFTLRGHAGARAMPFVELHDGSRIQLWGVQARGATVASRRVPEEMVEALNEHLAEARARQG